MTVDGYQPSYKRRRLSNEHEASRRAEDDDGEIYVPIKQRRQAQLSKLSGRAGSSDYSSRSEDEDKRRREAQALLEHQRREEEREKRRQMTLLIEAQEVKKRQAEEAARKSDAQRQREEEDAILKAHLNQRKLVSDRELATGVDYREPLKTSWRAPTFARMRSPEENADIRHRHHVLLETSVLDDDVAPPLTSFADMKLPKPVLDYLKSQRILKPTPIQVQGLPLAFSGRDIIGVAFTGSGKTLTFSLPLLMLAVEDEMRLPYTNGEGPIGLILCPSRELARQTYERLVEMGDACAQGGLPKVRSLLAIGGISMDDQRELFKQGMHIVVATPGRLKDLLSKGRISLDLCRYLCIDEADRMIDMGFEEDVRELMSFFKHQRQTLLFSATMPAKIRDFAQTSLVRPVTVNVGRAGAANLDVIQEVEYVKPEAKMVYLLECLQKTPPPVIIFSENKNEVDDIQEYLLLKGVEAVAIHGSKTQEEREYAMRSFKTGKKDVMVASGVASKGLDFAQIQHVINFSMPGQIEDYVHQIGRTGRSGRTGIATTFVNPQVQEETLLDLKHLLIEAKQRIPPFLASIEDVNTSGRACQNCGGLGHTITQCPRLLETQRRNLLNQRRADDGGY